MQREESFGGNYNFRAEIRAAIVGKETFWGLMMLVLVSWRVGCIGTMGVECWGGRAILLLACDSTLLTSILCM